MTIMFDFDGTFSADLKLMRQLADLCLQHGHAIVMITSREGTEDNQMLVKQLVRGQMPVLFAGRRKKRDVAREAGYEVDVWIEDNPVLVDFGVAGLEMAAERRTDDRQLPRREAAR